MKLDTNCKACLSSKKCYATSKRSPQKNRHCRPIAPISTNIAVPSTKSRNTRAHAACHRRLAVPHRPHDIRGPWEYRPTERFNELSSLLGEGIISGIWLYAEDKPDVVHATFDALPPLLRALDIGSVRFLKVRARQLFVVRNDNRYQCLATVPHSSVNPLVDPSPFVGPDRVLQLSALRVLGTVLDVCIPRIPFWKEALLDAVGRCWVGLVDEERKGLMTCDIKLRNKVKRSLQDFCVQLAKTCPSVIQEEYPRFLKADRELFEDLFSEIVNMPV
ncbi:hypothetical protein BJ912DRAFT_445053 [Pholiota molesta]|nr:hypothetical protein BJ912DRAFT_445053 [Pholiota molesta]